MQTETRILLVDDEKLVRRSMEKTLARAGYDVETADNCAAGQEAFEAAEKSDAPFDLAVLDLNMPGFDGAPTAGAGLDLLSKLLATRATLPVIILSAYDEVGKAKEAVVRGARAYFVKGREQGLVDLINEILENEQNSLIP